MKKINNLNGAIKFVNISRTATIKVEDKIVTHGLSVLQHDRVEL